jgi:HK97 family phage portal protein
MTLSAVYRAVAIKAGIIASAPFKVYRKTSQGRVEASDHPVSFLLSRKPNSKINKTIYFDRAMQHFELYGNHYAKIKRNGIGRVVAYELIHPDRVSVKETEDRLIYEVDLQIIPADDLIHVPNMGNYCVGKSVLSYMRDDASLMMDIRDYGGSFYGGGGKPAGLLIPKASVTSQSRAEMKASFKEAKSQGGDVAMPFGWDYKEISVPPAEAEWVVSNNFSVEMVARWFGVPTQKLGDSKVKYNNVESMAIEFLQDTMAPIASKFELEYTTKSFMLSGEQDLYCEINMDGYQRADSETKAKLYATYIQNGIKTPNEIRSLNNDPKDPYGDDLMIQGATVPIRMQEGLYNKPQTNSRTLKKQIEKKIKEGIDPQLILEGIFGNDGKGL